MIDFFFARQPILDAQQAVFGYELLFRNNNHQNIYDLQDGNQATLEILSNAIFYSSFQQMVNNKIGLVNFTRDLLFDDAVLLFSSQSLIVEVLEDVIPDEAVIAACKRLKESGYKIALDDFIPDDLNNPLLDLASIVKVDFLKTLGSDRKLIADRLLPRNITLLAEKVETENDFREGRSYGYELFQGYFFGKPVIKTGKQFAPSQIMGMRILQAVFKSPCNYDELCSIISSDVSLSYKMLKMVNSPFFGFQKEISSIRHSITLMGYAGMKRFVSLLVISNTSGPTNTELAIIGLARARIAEQIAPYIGLEEEKGSLFLTGLFSLLDALLECSMNDILKELPIASEIKDALTGTPNKFKNALDAIVAYEKADWEGFSQASSVIGLQEERFPSIYSNSIKWATDIFQSK
jgi:c-di-GMP-related signal transduction protein